MALLKTCDNLTVDGSGREMRAHGSARLPCAGYNLLYSDNQDLFVPWHWHGEIELVYITSGSINFKIPDMSFDMEAGDFLAINANIAHFAKAPGVGQLKSIVFAPELVGGVADSVFTQKYTAPLTGSGAFVYYYLKSGQNSALTGDFLTAFDAIEHEPHGFEFIIRERLSNVCLFLYDALNIARCGAGAGKNAARIRDMLEYIHKNYFSGITLKDIAAAAHVSRRECLRSFKKNIQMPPMQYLLKYRIMQGARLLSEKPEESVSGVAMSCGFDSPSNFTRTFKRFYGKTPKEYRAK